MGLDLSGQDGDASVSGLHGAGGIGGLLAVLDTNNTTTTSDDRSYAYLYDANGNVGQLVEWSSGAGGASGMAWASGRMVATYEYDPYGNTVSKSGTYADTNLFRFSTKFLDAETGLYYYGYRYYSPRLGRWVSRHPIEEAGGVNLYRGIDNRPTNDVDGLGLHPLVGLAEGVGTVCMQVLCREVFGPCPPFAHYEVPKAGVCVCVINTSPSHCEMIGGAAPAGYHWRVEASGDCRLHRDDPPPPAAPLTPVPPVTGFPPGRNPLDRITAAACRNACMQLKYSEKICSVMCKGLKNTSCRGFEAMCHHIARHAPNAPSKKQSVEACWATYMAMCANGAQ
ncbi:MAG: RHS repeat-associated core domain-containing protein [Planctomycetia bacterium]|nr:MAG: RHS repeat-associated core domain-containing protein [Planctomycetia bacterium]